MIDIKVDWDRNQLANFLNKVRGVEQDVFYNTTELPRQLSIVYVDEIRSFVIKGMLPSNTSPYASYNSMYAAWKRQYGTYKGFWSLMGDLYSNVISFRFAGGYFGGIRHGATDKGGKSWLGSGNKGKPKSIVMYAKVMEYGMPVSIRGSGVHPARPMFAPVFKQFAYSKSKATRGNAWIISEKALKIIGNHWEGKP